MCGTVVPGFVQNALSACCDGGAAPGPSSPHKGVSTRGQAVTLHVLSDRTPGECGEACNASSRCTHFSLSNPGDRLTHTCTLCAGCKPSTSTPGIHSSWARCQLPASQTSPPLSAPGVISGDEPCFAATVMCKYLPECDEWLKMHLNTSRLPQGGLVVQPFLVTGTSASGTQFITDVLIDLGVDVAHEVPYGGHTGRSIPSRIQRAIRSRDHPEIRDYKPKIYSDKAFFGRDGLVSWSARCTSMLNGWPDSRAGGPLSAPAGGDGNVKTLFRRVIHIVRHPINMIRSWLFFADAATGAPVCSGSNPSCWLHDIEGEPFIPLPWPHKSNGDAKAGWLRYIQVHTYPLATLIEQHADTSSCPSANVSELKCSADSSHLPHTSEFIPPHSPAWRDNCSCVTGATLVKHQRVMAARFWLAWNRLAEAVSDFRFQVESTSPQEVCKQLGLQNASCEPVLGAEVNASNVNSHAQHANPWVQIRTQLRDQVQPCTWEALRELDPELEAAVWAAAQRYGYGRDAPKRRSSSPRIR